MVTFKVRDCKVTFALIAALVFASFRIFPGFSAALPSQIVWEKGLQINTWWDVVFISYFFFLIIFVGVFSFAVCFKHNSIFSTPLNDWIMFVSVNIISWRFWNHLWSNYGFFFLATCCVALTKARSKVWYKGTKEKVERSTVQIRLQHRPLAYCQSKLVCMYSVFKGATYGCF